MRDLHFLELQDLAIGYNEVLVEGINASLKHGEICMLMGNNGEGKTTLLRTILQQISVKQGEIRLKGNSLSSFNRLQLAKEISVVFSKSPLPQNMTVQDLLALGKYIHYPYYFTINKEDRKEIDQITGALGLEPHRNALLTSLSDGNLQKAFIGRALVQNTPMMILDEPTSHLDELNQTFILQFLRKLAKEQNKTILFTSHHIETASAYADNIWRIRKGSFTHGLAEDLLLDYLTERAKPLREKNGLPAITAPSPERRLMKRALRKNLTRDCSDITIEFKNETWFLTQPSGVQSFSSISMVLNFLNNP